MKTDPKTLEPAKYRIVRRDMEKGSWWMVRKDG